MKRLLLFAMGTFISFVILVAMGQNSTLAEEKGMPAPPPARKIPGITAEDSFPRGCVDCHINHPEMNMDVRISTSMKKWNDKVDPKLLAKMQALAPAGVTLTGRHPIAESSLKDIPAACGKCHSRTSKSAIPFSRMMHSIHLTGGEESHYLTLFQGECTHCHKFNAATGEWSLPSGPEK